jgi:nitroreductase
MDTHVSIRTKRDSREYDTRPISDDALDRILQAGRMAGSSKNTQPWRFVVLREEASRAALAECGQFAKHVPPAPLAIAIVLTPGGGPFDAGRAAQNMMLAAWADGITSCPVAMHDQDCATKTLGLPADHRVAMVISFGYPKSKASLHRGIPRTPMSDLVRYERW